MSNVEIRLPSADESVRCAPFTQAAGIDPGGTAFRADVVLAVELPLPWPKPVFDHPAAGELREAMRSAEVPTRVLTQVPPADADPARTGIAVRRLGADHVEHWYVPPGDLGGAVEAIIAGNRPAGSAVTTSRQPEAWICTQGTHDLCCGADGTRLAETLARQRPDVRVRRVSHTGGHRFAPTAYLPATDRMWAHLTADDVEQIVDGGPARDLAGKCRGWTGADSGAAQVAEREVYARVGGDWEPTSVEHHDAHRWTVRGAGSTYSVVVSAGRQVPTIACRVPGGEPVKLAQEYTVDSIEPLGHADPTG